LGVKNKDQIIHWVSGKGGVGKSTVAAAMALAFARQGQKTLLVELGGKSFFRYVFELEVGHDPKPVLPGLSIARWDGEDCLKEYLRYLLKLEAVVDMFFENRVMRSLVQAAPGLRELALTGKITSGIRGVGPTLTYDRIIVDCFSTGHFRALIDSPAAMSQAIPVGPMGEQSRSILELLKSPKNSRYHVVAAPEELPVTEGLQLCAHIRTQFGVEPEFLLNRFLVPPVTREELKELPAGEFNSYLDFLMERQERLWVEASRSAKKIRRLPYSWETSPRERIERLSQTEWK
jgi:hypothetical protein